jgi:hypothetical protein
MSGERDEVPTPKLDRAVEALRQAHRRRPFLLRLAIVAGLVLPGSAAFAWFTGWLPALITTVSPHPPEVPKRAEERRRPRGVRAHASTQETPRTVEPVLPVAPPVPPAPSSPRRSAPRWLAPPSTPPAQVPPAEPQGDPELADYRRAHEAHFRGGDDAAALVAWDRYLERWPDGRMGPEARYNRAVLLVRLGRHEAAAAALRPFAEGRFGGYRRAEATALLETLDAPR